jgi:hypothetical protein
MNKNEAKQHARDCQTVERAVRDAERGSYNPPVGAMEEIGNILTCGLSVSSGDRHSDDVYRAAHHEASK